MRKKHLLLMAVLVCGVVVFVFQFSQQSFAYITLLGAVDFEKSHNSYILYSREDATLGGTRGDLIKCVKQTECLALGVANKRETVFVIKAGKVTSVPLQKAANESYSDAFVVSRSGRYWWTTDDGLLDTRPNVPSQKKHIGPNMITVYERSGKIRQEWVVEDGRTPERMDALGEDSVVTVTNAGLLRYRVGVLKPEKLPHGEKGGMLGSFLDKDGYIWSEGERLPDNSISWDSTKISSSNSPTQNIKYPGLKYRQEPFWGDGKKGFFSGFGGTLDKMSVTHLLADGTYKTTVAVTNGPPVGFVPPKEARYLWSYLWADEQSVIVATKVTKPTGPATQHFILKLTAVPRWKTWFSKSP